jgi:hypothetical protein
MERLNGSILKRPIATQVPAQHLPEIDRQIADILFQLENMNLIDGSGVIRAERLFDPNSALNEQRRASNPRRRLSDSHFSIE